MSVSDRPGGLTALAVLNGFFTLTLGVPALEQLITSRRLLAFLEDPESIRSERLRGHMKSWSEAGLEPGHLMWLGSFGLVVAVLLAISVWGLMRKHRWAGKWCSTAAAFGMIAVSLIGIEILPRENLQAVGLTLIRQLFYPLFLLFMVQVIFRNDLGPR